LHSAQSEPAPKGCSGSMVRPLTFAEDPPKPPPPLPPASCRHDGVRQ
jgi:hypothetical protein